MARTQKEIIHLMKNGFELRRLVTNDTYGLTKEQFDRKVLLDRAHKSSILALVKKGIIKQVSSKYPFDNFELVEEDKTVE